MNNRGPLWEQSLLAMAVLQLDHCASASALAFDLDLNAPSTTLAERRQRSLLTFFWAGIPGRLKDSKSPSGRNRQPPLPQQRIYMPPETKPKKGAFHL
ncbi:hypothetical protein [Pseudomonas citri]|uniref:hypothetical protein n=1 Tax=Pseudomonas citri TaxID=2978349 RepID=UPI0021B637FD|nr:hypothetical protein [Pseudomonas citri]